MRHLVLAAGLAAGLIAVHAAAADPLIHPDQTVPDSGSFSGMTAAFVAAVGPFNGFLLASDRLAEARGGGVRAFAAREATQRGALIDELRSWAAGIRRARDAEAHAPTIDRLGPVFGLLDDPINLVTVPADLQQRRDLSALEKLEGRDFDALYLAAQRATLEQLEATYVDYIKNGDDQVLRALSVRDRKRVRALLAALPNA